MPPQENNSQSDSPYTPDAQPQMPPRPSQPQFQAPLQPNPQYQTQQLPQPQPSFAPDPDPTRYTFGYRSTKKSVWQRLLIIFAVILLLAGGGTAAYFVFFQKKSPDDVFKNSLVNALSTSSVTQQTKGVEGGSEMNITYDVKNVKEPRVSSSISLSLGGVTTRLATYSTAHNTYLQYSQLGGMAELPDALKGKWVQLVKDGKLAEGQDASMVSMLAQDAQTSTLGHYIFGNFSDAQRRELVDYALRERVYDYDGKAVKTEKLDGRDVYVYSIKTDRQKLKDYNKKVGAMTGASNEKIDQATFMITSSLNATLYVDIKDQRLVKVTVSDGTTTTYSKWNETSLPGEPKADYPYDEYLKIVSSAGEPQQPAPEPQENPKAQDTERQADLRSIQAQLEAYYAENGEYPSFDQLNSPVWRSQNLSGIDKEAFKDPASGNGTLADKPVADQYAYQVGSDATLGGCDNQGSQCQHYLLTATLSDGTVYTRKSLN